MSVNSRAFSTTPTLMSAASSPTLSATSACALFKPSAKSVRDVVVVTPVK